jgi:hypothetical protein
VPVTQIVDGSKLQLVPIDFVNVMQQNVATPLPVPVPTPQTSEELLSVGSAPLVHENPCPLQPLTVALEHVCAVEPLLLLDEHATETKALATRNKIQMERRDLIGRILQTSA